MRKFLIFGLAIAVVPAGIAFAQNGGLKVTGGGQVIASANTPGPGDTIAFNAQQTGAFDNMDIAPAKGQLQVVNRTAGTGPDQVKFHGNVTCIREFVDENDPGEEDDERFIRFGGFEKVRGQQTPNAFTVDAQDNGEGANAPESDMILFRERGNISNPCDDSEPDTELRDTKLARGNVQEH